MNVSGWLVHFSSKVIEENLLLHNKHYALFFPCFLSILFYFLFGLLENVLLMVGSIYQNRLIFMAPIWTHDFI